MAIVNFLSWGATFLYRNVASYLDINLLIGYTGQEKVPITGTMTGSVPLLDANRVKITQERFVFLIDTALLSATGLVLQRGLEIQIQNGKILLIGAVVKCLQIIQKSSSIAEQ